MSYKINKLKHLLKTHEWSDCFFIINNEKVPAHKLILSFNSPVFEMMFYGSLPSSEIEIKDIDVKDFKTMLEFVYTNLINFESIQQAWNLVYIGQKYLLNELIDTSIDYIQNNLNIKNLLLSYEYSDMFNFDELKKSCFHDVLMHTREIFLVDNYHIKIDTLWDILNMKEFSNINDDELKLYVLKWIEEECRVKNLAIINENIYEIANNYGLLKYVPYVTRHRQDDIVKKSKMQCICAFRQMYKISKSINFNNSISLTTLFQVDKKCFVSGVSVLTLHRSLDVSNDKYVGDINVKIVEVRDVKAETELCNKCLEYDESVVVYFPNSLIVKPKVLYQIVVTYFCDNYVEMQVLLNFYNTNLKTHRNVNFEFIDEFDGSVINGIACYPV